MSSAEKLPMDVMLPKRAMVSVARAQRTNFKLLVVYAPA